MRASIKLYFHDGKTKRGFPIKLVVTHNQKSRRKTIGHCLKHDWDELKQLPLPTHPIYEDLVGYIYELRAKFLKRSFEELIDIDLAMDYLIAGKKIVNVSLKEYFNRHIEMMRLEGRDGTADEYRSVSNQFSKYAPVASLSDVNIEFVSGFKLYKSNVSDKTIKNYIGVLKSLYNKALLDPKIYLEDQRPFVGAFDGLVIRRRRKFNRYLTKKQLRKMDLALPKEGMEPLTDAQLRAVELSLLQFYLAGADLKDVYKIEREHFFSGRVMLTRSKLGKYAEEFDVMVSDSARKIFEKYGNNGGKYVFPWRQDHIGYKNFRRNHNRDLRDAQIKLGVKLKPIDQNLNSKTMRHTFSTLAKFKRIDVDIIRELMGHERNDIDTVYKDKFPKKVRDKAHKKIINLLK